MNVAKSMNEGLQRRDEYDGTVSTVFICIIHYFIQQHKEYGICVNNMQQIILRVILSCSLSPCFSSFSLSLSLSLSIEVQIFNIYSQFFSIFIVSVTVVGKIQRGIIMVRAKYTASN